MEKDSIRAKKKCLIERLQQVGNEEARARNRQKRRQTVGGTDQRNLLMQEVVYGEQEV